jgi:hypothetical protein
MRENHVPWTHEGTKTERGGVGGREEEEGQIGGEKMRENQEQWTQDGAKMETGGGGS